MQTESLNRLGFSSPENVGMSSEKLANIETLIAGTDTVISADSYEEAFIVEADSIGNTKLLKSCGTRTTGASWSYEDRATAITTDAQGNIYFIVNGQGSYFEFGTDTVNAQQYSPLNGYYDVFTVSLDSAGNVRWLRNCGTKNKDDSGKTIFRLSMSR